MSLDQSRYLGVLSRCPAPTLKDFAESLLPSVGPVEVLSNRTGLAMVPMQDTAQGASFYLGEVLLAEAHVRVGDAPGYGACLGRDLVQALAIALLDAAVSAGLANDAIAAFVEEQAAALEAADQALLAQVETTRVEMETF